MRYCEFDNCTQSVWGTDKKTGYGYCKRHQYLRTDKKPKKTPAFAQKTRVRDYDFPFESQIDLFNWLWDEAKDVKGIVTCPYTGERLNRFYNTDMFVNCFAHVLNKKNYLYFKLNPENIRVVLPEFHRIVDQGTTLEKTNHPNWKFTEWDALVIAMKAEYIAFKKLNLLA